MKFSLFKKKGIVLLFFIAVILFFILYFWSELISMLYEAKEGFGTDYKLSLNYIYTNNKNKTSLNLFTVTDSILKTSSDKLYKPTTISQSKNPTQSTRSDPIDMSGTDNLWLILQPANSIDKFPKAFHLQINTDMTLNNGYAVDFDSSNNVSTSNTIVLNNTKNIGLVTLGKNVINIEGEGEIRDMNNVLYGEMKKITTKDNSFVNYDLSMQNILIDMDSIVIHFGKLEYQQEET